MTVRKRESAKELDERIVAEAGPWEIVDNAYLWPADQIDYPGKNYEAALEAAARVLNRLARRAK